MLSGKTGVPPAPSPSTSFASRMTAAMSIAEDISYRRPTASYQSARYGTRFCKQVQWQMSTSTDGRTQGSEQSVSRMQGVRHMEGALTGHLDFVILVRAMLLSLAAGMLFKLRRHQRLSIQDSHEATLSSRKPGLMDSLLDTDALKEGRKQLRFRMAWNSDVKRLLCLRSACFGFFVCLSSPILGSHSRSAKLMMHTSSSSGSSQSLQRALVS